NGRRSLKKILDAVRDAGGTLVYVLGIGTAATARRAEELRAEFPEVAYLSMSELFGGPLLTEFSRSLTRARVLQYQRYFSDADRDALCDKVGHAVLQPADQSGRSRRVLVLVPARRCGAHPQDGGRRNHDGAPRLRSARVQERLARGSGLLRLRRSLTARRLHS